MQAAAYNLFFTMALCFSTRETRPVAAAAHDVITKRIVCNLSCNVKQFVKWPKLKKAARSQMQG